MAQTERVKLLFGPYATPKVRVGEVLSCESRDDGGEAVWNGKRHLAGELLAYTNKCGEGEIEIMTKPTTGIERIATSCIAGRLRLLNRVVTNIYDDALRPLDLKVSQMNILVAAAKLGV